MAPAGQLGTVQSARTFDLIELAASAGGIEAVSRVLAALPADFPVPIAVVQHRRDGSVLPVILARQTRLIVKLAQDGESIRPGTVRVAPSAIVIAQEKATSRVFGTPAAAIATGCVDLVLPLEQIGPTLVQLVSGSQAPGGPERMSRPTP